MDEIREEAKIKAEEAKAAEDAQEENAEQKEFERMVHELHLENVSPDFLAMIMRREERRKRREERVWPYPRRTNLSENDNRNIAAADAKRARKRALNAKA